MSRDISSSEILAALSTIIHPESGENIVAMGLVGDIRIEQGKPSFTIRMTKAHDPLGGSLRRAAVAIIEKEFGVSPSVVISDPKPVNTKQVAQQKMKEQSNLSGVKKVIAISSGKGGVGKSSVTTNTAIALASRGYKVGVLDADIYGPSMPTMFGSKDYIPVPTEDSVEQGEQASIEPSLSHGVKVMSIGYFIKDTDALVWRGPMATSALRQLMHQTAWGELDFLLIDLPPGTSDVHLTVVSEVDIDAAVIVTTPQLVALADVVRGIEMFRTEHINIPVLGIVENMAWFEPEPEKRYYIFGKGKIEAVSEQTALPVIASIPIFEELAAACDNGMPLALSQPELFAGVVQEIEKVL